MKTNHEEVLLARNRNKKRVNVFFYEGMLNIMRSTGYSASEFAFACSVMAIEAMNGCKLPYIKKSDRLILNNIRVCITHSK
jgi:hypothetical protein